MAQHAGSPALGVRQNGLDEPVTDLIGQVGQAKMPVGFSNAANFSNSSESNRQQTFWCLCHHPFSVNGHPCLCPVPYNPSESVVRVKAPLAAGRELGLPRVVAGSAVGTGRGDAWRCLPRSSRMMMRR